MNNANVDIIWALQ